MQVLEVAYLVVCFVVGGIFLGLLVVFVNLGFTLEEDEMDVYLWGMMHTMTERKISTRFRGALKIACICRHVRARCSTSSMLDVWW